MRIKLLLLSLITPLLCGVSFGASSIPGSLVFSDGLGYSDCQNMRGIATFGDLFSVNDISNTSFGCFYIHGPGNAVRGLNGSVSSSSINGNISLNLSKKVPIILCGNTTYLSSYLTTELIFDCNALESDYSITFELYDLSSSNDCSSIQSQLNTCSNALSGVSANLTSCQSDLSSCSNSCDTLVSQCLDEKATLSGNLVACNEDKSSLQNYNDSLSSQLNECLSSGTGGVGSGLFLSSFDIFWQDGNDNFSLPITNNLFLPYGYKGKLNDGVLSITKNNSLEYAYSIDDNSFQSGVVDMFGKVFVFFMSSGLFLVFLYAIRRYFIGLKSFK